MISHMRGHTSDMDAIMALCDAAGVPVIEDAAHSLGTVWGGRNIGTIGKVGCFSFQSYKLVNAGEGGIMITDDPEIAARAIIMSGAYETNWKKHPGLTNSCAHWQNKLPLYNLRMQNLSAAVIRPQLPLVAERVAKGRAGHDRVAASLNLSAHLDGAGGVGARGARAGFDPVQPDRRTGRIVRRWTFRRPPRRAACSVQVFGLERGQCAGVLELAVPGRGAGPAADAGHADAGL